MKPNGRSADQSRFTPLDYRPPHRDQRVAVGKLGDLGLICFGLQWLWALLLQPSINGSSGRWNQVHTGWQWLLLFMFFNWPVLFAVPLGIASILVSDFSKREIPAMICSVGGGLYLAAAIFFACFG